MSSDSTKKVINDYSFFMQDRIGSGCSSQVYKGINDKTNEPVAIKVVAKVQSKKELNVPLAQIQIQWLKRLRDEPHILQFISAIQTKNNIYVITELCEGGSLTDIIRREQRLSESKAITYMEQIICGYKVIAGKKIIHRDLKPMNIFIKGEKTMIGDFGFAIDSGLCAKPLDQNVGSPLYMPLETLSQNEYSYKSDIWALGIIFLQMLLGKTPWKSKTERELKHQLSLFILQEIIPTGISSQSKQFLLKTLKKNVNERMSLQELNAFSFAKVSSDQHHSKAPMSSMAKLKNTLSPREMHIKSSINSVQKQANTTAPLSSRDETAKKSMANLMKQQTTQPLNKKQAAETSFLKKNKYETQPTQCSEKDESSGSTSAQNQNLVINIIKPKNQINKINSENNTKLFSNQNLKTNFGSPKKQITEIQNQIINPQKQFEYASPKREYTSPRIQYTSPKREFTSPKREYTSPKRELPSPKREYLSPKKINIPETGQLLQKFQRYERAESYVFNIRNKIQTQKNLANRSQVYSKQKFIEKAKQHFRSISKDKEVIEKKTNDMKTTFHRDLKMGNAKQDTSLKTIPETKVTYYERQILTQLQAQINYFRFLFKVFKKVNEGLKTADEAILSMKSNFLFLIFKKMQQIKELKFVKGVTKQNKQDFINSKSYANLLDVVNNYIVRYEKENARNNFGASFKSQKQFVNNLTSAINLLYQNIMKIQLFEAELNKKKSLVFIIQDLIQLGKLFLLEREQNWDRFFLKSNMTKIVQQTSPLQIGLGYWRSVKKRVQQFFRV